MRNQALIGACLFALALWAAWEIGNKIIAGALSTLYVPALLFAGCVAVITILRNWRTGFYIFLVWLLFEDLVRKFMGNGTAFFFGKDVLVLLVYISLFVSIRR
ncbi:MAG TPA: hypothetical protein VN822_13150, partial [Candidatus Acidoferrales bacterium]|nr:hypothetical protein [Candidatus Acidoferrales bacterium]